jgi:CMP-N-acetylneuraminic acid synthetase
MWNDYKITGLICCRGGSKGIPGKNIKPFCGKPLLQWVLEAAREANVFDEIVLSTDSPEIAGVGEKYGATVPGLRPAHLAADTSDQFDTHTYIFDLLGISDTTHRVCILCNNPFVDSKLIRGAYDKAVAANFSRIVLDCVTVGSDYLYYRQCFERQGVLKYYFPHLFLSTQINRQTDSITYCAINNVRFCKPSFLRGYAAYKEEVAANGFLPVPLPKERTFDLDTQDDWAIAEAVFQKVLHNG